MFDLKLTDIFSTICIGILTLSLILYFYFIFNKFFIKDKFNNDKFLNWIKSILGENYKESGYAILALVVIYCMGIIAGDLTERMADSGDTDKNKILKELKWFSGMKTQEEARKEVLFLNDTTLSGLGQSVLRTKAIVKNANLLMGSRFFLDTVDINIQLKKTYSEIKNDSNKRSLYNRFIQQIYYAGKNWCYSKNNEPLNELKSIQSRIDLSKSMILLVALSIQLLAIMVIINILITAFLIFTRTARKDRRAAFKSSRLIHLFQLQFLLVLVSILFIAKECFDINESNYNKRAYGYYVNYIQQLEIDKQLKQKE